MRGIHPFDSLKLDALCIKEICRVLMLVRHECCTWFQIIQNLCIHVYPGNVLVWTVLCAWFLCLIFHFARYNHFIFLNEFSRRSVYNLQLIGTRVICQKSPGDLCLGRYRQILGLWNVIYCFCLKMSSCFWQYFCHTFLQFAPGVTKGISPTNTSISDYIFWIRKLGNARGKRKVFGVCCVLVVCDVCSTFPCKLCLCHHWCCSQSTLPFMGQTLL